MVMQWKHIMTERVHTHRRIDPTTVSFAGTVGKHFDFTKRYTPMADGSVVVHLSYTATSFVASLVRSSPASA